MSDGEQPGKQVLLKAEVGENVAKKLDELAEDLGFSTRAKLIRHIISQYLNPQATFQEYERIDPGHGGREQARQDFDMSELTAVLHTLNKSMDQNTVHLNIIARQNETIHKLVDTNETLQTQLMGNGPAALPEPSQTPQEQDQTRTEVVEDRTEPPKDSPEVEQTRTEMGTTEEQDEPQDRQPLTGGDVLTVLEAETLAMSLGVKVSKDTFRRATTEKHGGKLLAVPDRKTLGLYTQDVRAFIEAWKVGGSLKTMPQIRDGKPLE